MSLHLPQAASASAQHINHQPASRQQLQLARVTHQSATTSRIPPLLVGANVQARDDGWRRERHATREEQVGAILLVGQEIRSRSQAFLVRSMVVG
jgi:hypothetical protein